MLHSSGTVKTIIVCIFIYFKENEINNFSFVKTSAELSNQLLPSEDHVKKGELTPAMDIFSAG